MPDRRLLAHTAAIIGNIDLALDRNECRAAFGRIIACPAISPIWCHTTGGYWDHTDQLAECWRCHTTPAGTGPTQLCPDCINDLTQGGLE